MSKRVVMISLWRDDADRALPWRVAHLLSKTYENLRWLWVVGDSTDDTANMLWPGALRDRLTVVDIGDTGCPGESPEERLMRLSATVNAALAHVHASDDYVCIHESDLQSPPNVIERLLETGHPCVAAWTVLRGNGIDCMYDSWATRGLDGQHFTNQPPYHPDYRPDTPFPVTSFGSVYLFPAAAVRAGLQATTRACVDLCAGLRAQGHTLWVDPTLTVVQPADLWVAQRWAAEVPA